jgi:hypothetical protein
VSAGYLSPAKRDLLQRFSGVDELLSAYADAR